MNGCRVREGASATVAGATRMRDASTASSAGTPPRTAEGAAGRKGGSPVFTPSRTPARLAAGAGDRKSDTHSCTLALDDAQQTRRRRRAALLRRAERAAQQADPQAARDRCSVVAKAILTARAAASGQLLQLDERHQHSAAQQRRSAEEQRRVACRSSAEALLQEREVLSRWVLQSQSAQVKPDVLWSRGDDPAFGGMLEPRQSERRYKAAMELAMQSELTEAQRRERYMEELVLAVQSEHSTERRAAEQERTKLVDTIVQLQDQVVAGRISSQMAAATVLADRAALSERLLASELYTPGCRAPEVALKLQVALCVRRTAEAVAASGKLFEARDRVASRISAHARAEAEHGCSLAAIQQGAQQVRAELAYIRRLSDGSPYRTLCRAGIT